MNILINTIIFTILISLIFNNIPNKSNFPKEYIIPLLTVFITKYVIGDWDIGSKYSYKDIYYFLILLLLSYIVTKLH